MNYSLPGSSAHGILQARIQEWVVILFSIGSFQPRDWSQVFCITGRFFNIWATSGAQNPVISSDFYIYGSWIWQFILEPWLVNPLLQNLWIRGTTVLCYGILYKGLDHPCILWGGRIGVLEPFPAGYWWMTDFLGKNGGTLKVVNHHILYEHILIKYIKYEEKWIVFKLKE